MALFLLTVCLQRQNATSKICMKKFDNGQIPDSTLAVVNTYKNNLFCKGKLYNTFVLHTVFQPHVTLTSFHMHGSFQGTGKIVLSINRRGRQHFLLAYYITEYSTLFHDWLAFVQYPETEWGIPDYQIR